MCFCPSLHFSLNIYLKTCSWVNLVHQKCWENRELSAWDYKEPQNHVHGATLASNGCGLTCSNYINPPSCFHSLEIPKYSPGASVLRPLIWLWVGVLSPYNTQRTFALIFKMTESYHLLQAALLVWWRQHFAVIHCALFHHRIIWTLFLLRCRKTR